MNVLEGLLWLTLTVFFEARDQPFEGQVGVCQVVLNRSEARGAFVKEIVQQPSQFSWWEGEVDLETLGKEFGAIQPAYMAVVECLARRDRGDNLDGAKYFFNPQLVTPGWAKEFVLVSRIKDHDFMKE